MLTYSQDTLDRLKCDLKLMSEGGFHFGAKLVRGAYREQEKKFAIELGLKNPIHDTYEDTCTTYNTSMEIILQKVACSPAEVMLATHNEESVQLATNRLTKNFRGFLMT
jgi:proline dehydrogenase